MLRTFSCVEPTTAWRGRRSATFRRLRSDDAQASDAARPSERLPRLHRRSDDEEDATQQWFIDWDAESWGSTDEFDDALSSSDDRAAVCEPPFGAAVSFLGSYLPSFSSLLSIFINIFRVFFFVAW